MTTNGTRLLRQSVRTDSQARMVELKAENEQLSSANAQLEAKVRELETTTHELGSLLSSTSIAVVFLDSQLRVCRVTPAARGLFEFNPKDLGRPLSQLISKFYDENLLPDAKAVLKSHEAISREVHSSTSRSYVRSVIPYRPTSDQVDGVVITFLDITDRQRAERDLRETAEQHLLMLESLRDFAIFLLDSDGVIKSWPKAAERLFGHTREEAMGQPLTLIFPPENEPTGLAEHEIREARRSGSVSQEGWRLRKDGTRFWGRGVLSAAADEHGRLRGFVKVLRDDTERRRIEEDLRQEKRRAEAANEAKDQFLATVSHELRTPLSSILLWANLIDEEGDMNSDHVREALAAIKRGAEEQRELIEDLVDTARIAAGKLLLTKEPTDLTALARMVVSTIQPTAVDKGLKITRSFQSVGLVDVDPLRMRQVMANLLSNAVKFTGTGGRVAIELHRRGAEVELRVTDTGEGFTPEFQRNLFTRFEQASKDSTRAHGGLGIGLSIVKQIVVLHGGTITGESPGINQGATFVVRLPLSSLAPSLDPGSQAPFHRPKIAAALRGIRVLVVEDSPETQRALEAVLQEAGATVKTADTALQALESFEQEAPDLIVSDIGMPEMDGNQFMLRLREWERTRELPSVPALALTAFAGGDTAKVALQSGFQQCLSKPIEPLELVTALAILLARRDPTA